MIHGVPAGSLLIGKDTFGTALTRAAGAAGEVLTGSVLAGFGDRAEIFHDLTIPGHRINADHAVLAGNRLLILDSKNWKAGRYWSIGPWYFRGLERRHPPGQAVDMARRALADYLRPHRVKVVTPLVVLWSGGQTASHRPWLDARGFVSGAWAREEARPFVHFRYPGAEVIPGNELYKRLFYFTHPARNKNHSPDPGAVEALRRLLP